MSMQRNQAGAHRLPRWLAGLWTRLGAVRDESGSSVIEVALIMSIFGPPLLLGTVDMASVVYSSIEVSNAAHAGAMYGMMSSTYAEETTGIRTAAQDDAADFGTNMTVTPSIFYACSSDIGGTQYTTQSAANSGCTGSGNHALEFVQVNVSVPVTPAIQFPGLPSTVTLTSTAIMEVEE